MEKKINNLLSVEEAKEIATSKVKALTGDSLMIYFKSKSEEEDLPPQLIGSSEGEKVLDFDITKDGVEVLMVGPNCKNIKEGDKVLVYAQAMMSGQFTALPIGEITVLLLREPTVMLILN
jgi:hypothetical protein